MNRLDRNRDVVLEQLREQLLELSTPAFEHIVARLLRVCGYGDVQVLEGCKGGADLSASTSSGLSQTVTLVQAKQYRSPVSRRFVDELRGAMLRTGAQQGVLLTTSTFYLPAYRAMWKDCPLPVRLVDGPELLSLLLTHGLGVTTSAAGRLKIDHGYFAQLALDHGKKPHKKQALAADAAQRRSWLGIFGRA